MTLKAPAASGEALRLTWYGSDAKGYTDVYPPGEFDTECADEVRTHKVVRGGKDEGTAKYLLTVKGNKAVLDYSAFKDFNKRKGMYPGVERIEFTDDDRVAIAAIYWKDAPHLEFEAAEIELPDSEFVPGSPPPYRAPPAGTAILRETIDRKERTGQQRFRVQLKRAYNDTCCLTGCSTPDTLEAAHIDQHINDYSDVPSNGLLLRRDVHALFDRDFIGISPDGKVVVSKHLVGRGPYASLLQGKRLKAPHGRFNISGYRPASEALERRWEQFQKAEKNRER